MVFPDTSLIVRAPNYIKVFYTGDYQLAPLSLLGLAVVEWAKQHQVNGVIIDLTGAIGKLSINDRYVLVNQMSEKWPPDLFASVVVRPSQTLKLIGFFWERMALSRGFHVSIHFDENKAKQWILKRVYPSSH